MQAIKRTLNKNQDADTNASGVAQDGFTSSSSLSTSDWRAGATSTMTDRSSNVAVGLPQVGPKAGRVEYMDTEFRDAVATVAVSDIVNSTTTGKDVATTEERVLVPRTKMTEETVLMPEFQVERQHVEMPVTVTKLVPTIQRDFVMREEVVTREEVVVDRETVNKPVTVLKPVVTQLPRIDERKVLVPRPKEVMKTITVVRPENVIEEVKVQQPATRRRVVKVTRPVPVRRVVTVQRPVPFSVTVNVTQPEIREGEVDVDVPVTEERAVEYAEPVTVIRSAEQQSLAPATGGGEGADVGPAHSSDLSMLNKKPGRDWASIPVGLPFTEMVQRARNFTTTRLTKSKAAFRETWMQPMQVQKQQYRLEPIEVEVIETEMQEVEEEVEETYLEDVVMPVVVTVMREVEEEWPIFKEAADEVWTSEVTLEPQTKMVPEVAVQPVEVEVPRTVTHMETVQKPEAVEREVMVEQAVLENRQVSVEKPVEYMTEVRVAKPVTVYEEIAVKGVTTTEKPIVVQEVSERLTEVPTQEVEHVTRSVEFMQAQTVMTPTAVEGPVKVEGDTAIASVSAKGLAESAAARTAALEQQAGVTVPAVQHEGHIAPSPGSLELAPDATTVAPDAALPTTPRTPVAHRGSRGVLTERDAAVPTPVATDGHLVDPAYQAQLQGMVGKAVVPGRSGSATSVGTSRSSSDTERDGGRGRVAVTGDVAQGAGEGGPGGAKPKHRGIVAKIKDALSHPGGRA